MSILGTIMEKVLGKGPASPAAVAPAVNRLAALRRAPAGGEEHRQHPRGALALAIFAGDRVVGLLHRAQGIEFRVAMGAVVFVDGHLVTSTKLIVG